MIWIESLLITTRVLRNAKSGIFLRQPLVWYVYIFLPGILFNAKIFSADASQTHQKTTEEDSRSPNLASVTKYQKTALMRCPRICHKISELLTAPF